LFIDLGLPAKPANARGMLDAPCIGMTLPQTQLTFASQDGHTATFSYGLSETRGWDVRAEVDDRVVVERHCSNWRNVEHLYDWLRVSLRE
jgi:hypothetical protein